MPASDSPAVIVARFLQANHYTETLEAFLSEAGLSPDAGDTGPGDWTIEKILEEKKQYDASLTFEKKGDRSKKGWTLPAPSVSIELQGIATQSNVLSVSLLPGTDMNDDCFLISGADRALDVVDSSPPYKVVKSILDSHSGPILSVCMADSVHALSTSMSGQFITYNMQSFEIVGARRDHTKFAIQVTAKRLHDSVIAATAGWDQKVHLYALPLTQITSTSETEIREPLHTISLLSNPESLVFVEHPDTGILYLVLSRRDSTHLYYYSITPGTSSDLQSEGDVPSYTVREAGRQNLAPHSNAWVAFTPACLSLCPTDPTLLAVATSHLPHMKLIVVRLLFPESSTENTISAVPPRQNQSSLARASLAIADREDTAISLHVSTMAPQTPYSTPQVVWRPDGSGVWVNGDDGAVRGLEIQSGKVVNVLKGHEPGRKVRTLWAGLVGTERAVERPREGSGEKREVLVSGGFDKKVIVWEIPDTNSCEAAI